MKRTIKKMFFAWDYEKEEEWLNELSAKGLQLVDVGFGKYVFDDANPNHYTYRIELLKNLPSHPESVDYIKFLEELGAEHVASYLRWVYLRKNNADGEFNLYSDLDSRLKQYKRIIALLLCTIPMVLPGLILNLNFSFTNGVHYLNLFESIFLAGLMLFVASGIIKLVKKVKKLQKEKAIQE